MKKFSKELGGYNKEEVNDFLNEVILQTEKLLKRLEYQQKEINSLKQEIIHYKKIEKSLDLALANAEEVGNHIRKMASDESNMIIDEAKRNASKIVNDALIRSEKIELKTQQAERNLRVFKNKLRSIIQTQLDVVEEIETLDIQE